MMRTEIRGERITLKAYEKSFAPLLFEAGVETGGHEESARWMTWCRADYKIEESFEFAEKAAADWRDREDVWRAGRKFGYAIFERETGKFLGGVGINQPNRTNKFFNLGYWVRPSAQRRGAASAATRLLGRAAFEDLPELNRIEILVAADNQASLKAAEKAGARREGILRRRLVMGDAVHDAVMFSLVREDFQN